MSIHICSSFIFAADFLKKKKKDKWKLEILSRV